MTEPDCADCGNSVPMDLDHVHIVAELIHTDDRNQQNGYYFHTQCWKSASEEWMQP